MDHKRISQALALVLMTIPLSSRGWATNAPSCERFTLRDLSLGMSRDMVRSTMGGEGVSTIIRMPDEREASAADYPGPPSEVYVQYDHRVDRRPPARTVLVRASIRLSAETAQALVDRFGPPDAGADDLREGLNEGVAVWVDDACGVVLTAYRPPLSWWTAEGSPLLQLETLDHARRNGSPASSRLEAILARDSAPPVLVEEAIIVEGSPTEDPVIPLLPMSKVDAGSIGVASLLPANSPSDLVIPLLPMSKVDAGSIGVASLLPAVAPTVSARLVGSKPTAPSAPQTIANWHPSANTAIASSAPRTTAPSAPQTIANWHAPAPTAATPSSAPGTTAPSTPQTIATWHPPASTGIPSSAPRTTAPSAPQTIATWHPPANTAIPSSAPRTTAPPAPQTIATWRSPTTLPVSSEPSHVPPE